jgi:hypothetical protein
VSTTETNLGYIRRMIKPALGAREVRKVRGSLLDNLYTRLQQCGNLACAGKPFTEHRHVPDLRPEARAGSRHVAGIGILSRPYPESCHFGSEGHPFGRSCPAAEPSPVTRA